MSVLLEMLIPALVLSGVAVACLVLLPNAPSRMRLAIAAVGLLAWIMPWPCVRFSVDLAASGVAVLEQLDLVLLRVTTADELVASSDPSVFWLYALIALVVPGAVWFAIDCLALRRSIGRWHRRSRCGEALRHLLPAELASTRAEIRIVEGERVAAVSGVLRPTIWVGDGFASREDLRLVLVHECWHIRRLDPLWIVLIMAVRRAYWWNPVVGYLATQSVLMLESACDDLCARSIGRRPYVERLATMILDAEEQRVPRLIAAARNQNVLRLKLLSRTPRLRARDRVLLAVLSVAGFVAAASSVVDARVLELPKATTESNRVAIPDTPAGKALTALMEGLSDGDTELVAVYLGAYTPQEVSFPLQSTVGIEVVDILASDRLGIEYVLRDRASDARRVGRLQVADGDAIRIIAVELSDEVAK